MAANGISTLATKELRQIAKLELAQTKRIAQGNARPYYDITLLPTRYSDNVVVDNPNLAEFTVTPSVTRAGISKVTYTGYHNDDVAFTDTATVTATTTSNNFIVSSPPENTTVLYTGYLLADYTGDWTFTLTGDDSSYLWIGANAVSGYTTANENLFANYNTVGTVTLALTAGTYYPVRLLYGNGPATGYLNLTYAHTGQATTNNFTGKLFSPGATLAEGRPWVAVAPVTTGSLLIPDTSSRVTMSPGLAVGTTTTSPFTVEGWFYSTVNPGTDSGPVLLSTTTGSGTPAYYKALTVNVNSSTQVVVDSNGAAATAFDFAQTMVINAWYYLAVSRDTSGYIQVWMAKKGDATAAASTTGRYDSAGAGAAWELTGLSDCIGTFVPANRFTTGYISNLRVTNTNLYTTTDATIAVPTAPFTEVTGTVLLVNDTTLTDQTGNQTLTAVGTAAGNALNPF